MAEQGSASFRAQQGWVWHSTSSEHAAQVCCKLKEPPVSHTRCAGHDDQREVEVSRELL